MRTYHIASLPLDDVIHEIASVLQTNVEKKLGEYHLTLPKNIGSGTIKAINFENGLGIIQYDCSFHEDTEIQFIVNKVHPLKFVYVITGKLHHRFANREETHVVDQFQNAIIASSDSHGHILTFKKNIRTSIFNLEINRKIFQKKANYRDGMNLQLKKLFHDIHADESFYYEGEYSLSMADIFKKIEDFEGSEFLNMIFMESIAYQTLVQQISQFLDDQRQEKNRTLLRRTEVDGIRKASEYITNNLATYKSVPELTKETGLNATKLQEGFKYFYNKTVNQYVYEARLDLAKKLLLETDDSISEIVYKIGLSSKSYFSHIFKQEYGVQPSSFRKSNF
jgi:AraC-like DNA-binding protein